MPKAQTKARLRARVWERDKGICWICGKPVTLAAMSLDHEIPRVLGGRGGENLRASHKRCNSVRGAPGHVPPATVAPKKRASSARPRRVLNYITNENATTFAEKLSAQKRDEERLAVHIYAEARK